jgi:DNA-binding ferritin-like protein
VLNPFTLALLNDTLGTASCVQWEGDPSNVIGTATCQARKERASRESKELEDLSEGSQSLENMVRESIARIEERIDEYCPILFDQMMAMFEKENRYWLWY